MKNSLRTRAVSQQCQVMCSHLDVSLSCSVCPTPIWCRRQRVNSEYHQFLLMMYSALPQPFKPHWIECYWSLYYLLSSKLLSNSFALMHPKKPACSLSFKTFKWLFSPDRKMALGPPDAALTLEPNNENAIIMSNSSSEESADTGPALDPSQEVRTSAL